MPITTRKQYMEDTSFRSHRKYYSQFVTKETKRHISLYFTKGELAKALKKDKHFNSIEIDTWDSIVSRTVTTKSGDQGFTALLPIDRKSMAEAGETATLSTLVCIAKEAAHMIVEDARKA